MEYADLIIETKTDLNRQFFTYLIPNDLKEIIATGQVVFVKFGPRNIRGLIIKIHNTKPNYNIKPIIGLTGIVFSKSRIKTILWLAKYYYLSLGESLKVFLPPLLKTNRSFIPKNISIPVLDESKNLTKEQKLIYSNIVKSSNRFHLIHGVTGSGKTEIYISLINKIIANNGQVIYLLPEIFLASIMLTRLKKIFGDKIAIVHSKISKSEISSIYNNFHSGKLSIIVGSRSAIFMLPKNLELIIIDEEHDSSFKQEQSPRYDARVLAKKIVEFENCKLILGSATPRIEDYYWSNQEGYSLHSLDERFQQKLPAVRIVDMKVESLSGNKSVISEELLNAIKKILDNNRKALIFLNRRGIATLITCSSCGHNEVCPSCNLPLIHHYINNKDILICHQCSYDKNIPSVCENCGSLLIKSVGAGIQKIESEIKQLFPKKRIYRLDTDLKESEFKKISQIIESNKFDIIIGTQIIAKGLDLPEVDLVGVISADTALHFPDFYASEQTFSTLLQVIGRCGRRDTVGEAIIQSNWPENHSILFAAKHDYIGFYNVEIEARKTYIYPPSCKLIRIISQNVDSKKAKVIIVKLANLLKEHRITFSGPAPAFYSKIRNRYRYHLIIKFVEKDRQKIYDLLSTFQRDLIIDIDPTNML